MTKTTEWDCDDCRECAFRDTFENGRSYCTLYNIPPENMPQDGCELGIDKKKWGIHE